MSFDLFDLTAKRAILSPDAVAFEDLNSGARVGYAELDARSARAAGLMGEFGIRAGDRVALLCRNRIEFFELLFGCAKLGAVLVPLNWRMPAPELEPLIADCTPGLLIHGHEDADAAVALTGASLPVLDLDDSGAAGYAARRDRARAHPGRERWPQDETWYLLYTSGTTGQPKGVIQTYGMALANYVNIHQAMQIGADDVTLNYLPLFHTAGINLVTLPTLIAGGRVLVLPGFELEHTIELLDGGSIDTFFGVPAVYQEISLHPRFAALDLSRVRNFACGGAPMPDALIKRFAGRGARVCNGMGMTETGPTVFLMDPERAEDKIGSVGRPQLLAGVRLVADGRDVGPGETGEMWFAGPGITPGYWNRPDATAAAFVDGWLRSGDLGLRDGDGDYYVVGRLKEMYISGGENVYPAEVENQLAGHPAVLEAAVIGIPDPRWGEVGCAFVLARPGHALPDTEQLTAWCRARLAAYKVPKRFVEVSEFPRTAAGKVRKHLLKP